MHELSIVMGIIEIAEEELKKAGKERVTLIELEIGSLSGVELEALDFAWEPAVRGTVLEQAERKIDYIEARAVCVDCNSSFKIEHIYDNCPVCGSYLKNIVKGKELRVKALEVV